MDHVHWYRNIEKGRKYHAAREDWIQSGLGVCGASIRSPAYGLLPDSAFKQACEHAGRVWSDGLCKHCLRRLKAEHE